MRARAVRSPGRISAIAESDVVVAPYSEASQSGVVAAAFANGRAVIASRVGGLPDFISDGVNGLLVPPSDAGALSKAIQRWAASSDLQTRLNDGARLTAETTISWETAARSIISEFNKD